MQHFELTEEFRENQIPISKKKTTSSPYKKENMPMMNLLTLSDENEKRALIRSYKGFNKAANTQKFTAFLSWVEAKKTCNLLTFYHYVKEFYFSTKTAIVLYQRSEILSMDLTEDGLFLIVGGQDGVIVIWNLMQGGVHMELKGHQGQITSLLSKGNMIYTGSSDTNVIIWSLLNNENIVVLSGHNESILALAINDSGTLLASGGEDRMIMLWDLKVNSLKTELLGHDSAVSCLVFSPDEKSLISGSWDLSVKIWDILEMKMISSVQAHKDLSSSTQRFDSRFEDKSRWKNAVFSRR